MMKEKSGVILWYVLLAGVVVWVSTQRDFSVSNELRYLSIVDEAMNNGSFFVFSNHGVPYADKPPFFFWLMMICKRLVGSHCLWLLSLLSLLPALVVVRLMGNWYERACGSEGRRVAEVMLLMSGLFLGSALVLRPDMMMCMFIVAALREFWISLEGGGRRGWRRCLFGLYVFMAIFSKGAMGLIVPLCATVVYLATTKQLRMFFVFWGRHTWSVLIVLCGLWFWGVWHEGGSDYLYNLLIHQTVDRAVNSFHHDRPFYYYLLSYWYCFAPWALFVFAMSVKRLRHLSGMSRLEMFFWIVGCLTVFVLSLVSGKLQIYMLPAMPFLIFAAVMSSVRLGMGVWVCLSMVVPASVFVLSPVVVAIYDRVTNGGVVGTGLLYLAASGLAVAGGYCLYLAFSGKKVAEWLSRSVCVLSASLLWVLFVAGWGANEANGKIGYAKLCEKAQELGRQKHISNYYAQGISRPENMDVYLHRPINELPDGSLKGFKGPALLLTSREDLGGFVGCEKEIVGDYAVVVLNDAADGCSAKCKTMCRECGRQRMSN